MTYHTRLDINRLYYPTSTARVTGLRERLAEERHVARTGSAYDQQVAELNVRDLESALERAEANERIRVEREAALTAARESEEARIEAEKREPLWRSYILDHPNVERSWFDQHYGEIAQAHDAAVMEREVARLVHRFRI